MAGLDFGLALSFAVFREGIKFILFIGFNKCLGLNLVGKPFTFSFSLSFLVKIYLFYFPEHRSYYIKFVID